MSTSPQTNVTVEEELPLNTIAGSGNTHGNHVVISPGACGASCCDDKHHRKLAVCSIICGISCIGIKALINSVKAETTTDPHTAVMFSNRARRLGIISIVVWVSILALTPILMALISYLLTFQD